MPDFVQLSRGAKILSTVPIGDGGKVLNENFSLLNDEMESLTAHTSDTGSVHGATVLAVPNRLVTRNSSGGASFAALTATSITNDISVQRVTVSTGETGYSRPQINLVQGSNVTITVADNPSQNRVDVTLASSGGGGGGGSLATLSDAEITSPTQYDGLYYSGTKWINAAAPTFRGLNLSAGSNTSALNVTQTWDNSGSTYTAVRVNVTRTASASASRLASLEVGGTPVLTVDRLGVVLLASGSGRVRLDPSAAGSISDALSIYAGATTYFRVDGQGNTTIRFGGDIRFQTNAIGISVFGVTPVARAAIDADLKTALVGYGWLQSGGATPLNLDGGALTADSIVLVDRANSTGHTFYAYGNDMFFPGNYNSSFGVFCRSSQGNARKWGFDASDGTRLALRANNSDTAFLTTTYFQVAPVTFTSTSGSSTALNVTTTYNQASGTAANTDFGIYRTNTAAGSGAQLLIDAQVGGVSKFKVDISGVITADGSRLSALNASNLSSGTVATARLGSGTASSNTYLRGDQSWATFPVAYSSSFNATTDWGTASGGYYTITITHNLSTYDVFVQLWDTTATRVMTGVDIVALPTVNIATIRVPSSPDLRFAGRINLRP